MQFITKERKFQVGDVHNFDTKFVAADNETMRTLLGKDEIPEGYVAGWASTTDIDLVGDKVLPGAFDRSIREKGLNGPKGIKLLVQHDNNRPAGVIHKLEQRDRGLWIEAQLNLNISYVRDLYESAKMIGGLSFSIGYRLIEGGFRFVEKGDDSYWELKEVDLHEISVVTFPANTEAVMTFIKSAAEDQGFSTVAEFEKALVAFSSCPRSRNEANAFTRAVKKSLHIFAPAKKTEPPLSASTKNALDQLQKQLAELKAALK